MEDLFDLPAQTHSKSSRDGAKHPSKVRVTAQEKWVYETLQQHTEPGLGLSDWQLWRLAKPTLLFDQLSSMRRARIGLVWRSRKIGATPYHPVEDSDLKNYNRETDVLCAIWRMKQAFLEMPYERWVEQYKALAREKH